MKSQISIILSVLGITFLYRVYPMHLSRVVLSSLPYNVSADKFSPGEGGKQYILATQIIPLFLLIIVPITGSYVRPPSVSNCISASFPLPGTT